MKKPVNRQRQARRTGNSGPCPGPRTGCSPCPTRSVAMRIAGAQLTGSTSAGSETGSWSRRSHLHRPRHSQKSGTETSCAATTLSHYLT